MRTAKDGFRGTKDETVKLGDRYRRPGVGHPGRAYTCVPLASVKRWGSSPSTHKSTVIGPRLGSYSVSWVVSILVRTFIIVYKIIPNILTNQ
jgi:hypothetical protein